MNFRIGEYAIIIKPEDLFETYDVYFQFKMASSTEEDLDLWIIGAPLLRKYIVVFDKDKQEVGYYGKDIRYIGELENKLDKAKRINLIVIIFSIIIVCIILVFIILLYFKIKNNSVVSKQINYESFSKYVKNGNEIKKDF